MQAQTCGAGLAAHSALPRQIGAVAAAMSELLRVHTLALDSLEEAGRREAEAYTSLSRAYEDIASRLWSLADEAESYASLAAAQHDMAFMRGSRPLEAFEALVRTKRDLAALLSASAPGEETMLAEMRKASQQS
ncbi:MAG TPA: hypothetical protein VNN10_10885 [Dehalococcoidia bacterium]|nr:hypothetical protein [Dehalococcoidia bacterium]